MRDPISSTFNLIASERQFMTLDGDKGGMASRYTTSEPAAEVSNNFIPSGPNGMG